MFEIFVSLSLSMKKAQSEIVKCKRPLILWEFEINFYNNLGARKQKTGDFYSQHFLPTYGLLLTKKYTNISSGYVNLYLQWPAHQKKSSTQPWQATH